MSTSLRNKLFYSAFFLPLIGLATLAHAGPLATIDISVNSGSAYQAGVSTTSIFVDHYDSGGVLSPADAGTRVDIELLDTNGAVSNGFRTDGTNNTFFITDGVSTTYGDGFQSFTFFKAGSVRLRATSSNSITDTSNIFTVAAGAASKLIVLSNGETLLEGRDPSVVTTGKSGNPTAPPANSTFSISVQLTDAQYNALSGVNVVTLSAGAHGIVNAPATTALVNGVATFICEIDAPKFPVTFTATAGGLTAGQTTVTSAGPDIEKVNAFPSPYNPYRTNTVTGDNLLRFQYVVDEAKDITIKITDQFGQQVWEHTSTGLPNQFNIVTWDGKNDRGTVVAAGVYYALLESGGKLKSKKKFGVIK